VDLSRLGCVRDTFDNGLYTRLKHIFGGEKLPDEWLTIDDIYEYLNRKVPRDTIRSWIRTKKLRAYKPSRMILVKREDLEEFLKRSQTDRN